MFPKFGASRNLVHALIHPIHLIKFDLGIGKGGKLTSGYILCRDLRWPEQQCFTILKHTKKCTNSKISTTITYEAREVSVV